MKTALIWGAGNIGLAIAEKAKAEGFHVIVLVHNELTSDARLRELADFSLECDLGDPAQVQSAVLAVGQQVEQVHWWVYAAGDIGAIPLNKMDKTGWKKIMDANLNGVAYSMLYGSALLAADGVVTILGAVSEKMRLPGLSAYAAAKAGVEALAEVAGKELRKTVQVLRPGAVDTAFWKRVPFRLPAGALSAADVAEKAYSYYLEKRSGLIDL